MLLMISMLKNFLEHFTKKELQKTNQQGLRIEKVIKRKGNKFMSNGKDMINHLIAGLIKKDLIE